MKQIPLTQGKFALVDDADFELLNQWRWFCDTKGYAVRGSPTVDGKRTRIYMHRVIMNTPEGMETDHINHDKLDNCRENLRYCTTAENQHNAGMRKDNTTGYKGVAKSHGKYQAGISVDGKKIYLGTYATIEEAGRAYDDAAKKHHGEYANLKIGGTR